MLGILNSGHWDLFEIWYLVLGIFLIFTKQIIFVKFEGVHDLTYGKSGKETQACPLTLHYQNASNAMSSAGSALISRPRHPVSNPFASRSCKL